MEFPSPKGPIQSCSPAEKFVDLNASAHSNPPLPLIFIPPQCPLSRKEGSLFDSHSFAWRMRRLLIMYIDFKTVGALKRALCSRGPFLESLR
ncbi:hypothetical protein CDAR_394021 [Caerostris darwini]|uniref:Uncharacterized protein n=1 Tax=Caerostris darwini TaxID=1538125 RepID=A0AAV4N8L2_9ARAC|nr:hypothetical protein CDAR_394021 [Caerostris darwini]